MLASRALVVYLLPEHLGRNTVMTFEAMLPTFDPVAMLAWFCEFHADPGLLTTISAESIMKDGCLVVFSSPF